MDPKRLMLPAADGLGIHESTASTSLAVPQNVAPSDTVSRALATISDLLPNPREYPRRKSHARKKSPGHIPRPANPFILFRTAFVRSGHVPADVEPDHRNLSRIAGEVWRRMTPAEKKKWNDLADEVKEEHKREHPNYRYQPDFHRPEPVRRRKTRRRVIVEEVETESNSELGEDPAAIQNAEEGAPPSVQDAPPSSSSAVARHSNGISAGPSNSSSSKTRAGPRKRAAGVNMQPQPSKVKVRTVAVPERPREYLSKVAALVHAGHNGNALLQAVQSAPVSAPMSESERSVEPREQRPPRQQHLQLVSLAETPTPDELIVVSRRDPEGLRQGDVNSSMETDEWDPLEVPTDNYIYDGNAEADLAEFLRFTGDHDVSSEAWGIYVEDDVSAASSKAFPVLEPRTIKIPPLIVGKDSYGSNGKKFRYGPPPRYLPPMDTGLLPGARVPWTLSPSDQAHDPFLGPYKRAPSPTKQLPLLYSPSTLETNSSSGGANASMALNNTGTGTNGTNVMRRPQHHESRPASPSHNAYAYGGPVRNGLVRDMLGTESGGSSGTGSSNAMTRTLARSTLVEGVRRPSLPSSHIPGLDYIPIMQ